MAAISVQAAADVPVPDDEQVCAWVDAALDGERAGSELTVRFVAAEEGRALNAQYRGRDYATNVLSFPADVAPEVGLDLLGDIVICAAVVEAEANEQGKALDAHYAHLVVHGTLHLLGLDHEDAADAERMESRERSTLARLGIADPYASPA